MEKMIRTTDENVRPLEKHISIKWRRVILTGIGAYIASILLITLIVTGYAFRLAFQARGAPDQAKIALFAERLSGSWGLISILIVTFWAAVWVARRGTPAAAIHGGLVGGVVAVLAFIVGHTLSVRTLIDFAATEAAGWVGGLIVGRTTANSSKESSSGPSPT